MIPYGRQSLDRDDIAAVLEVLQSDFLTQGPVIGRFEAAVAAYCGIDHAVAVNSATSALHIACLALDIGPGDLLWTTPNTFVASANCARYCGADVDFVDIDPRTYNLCADRLAEKLNQAERAGRLPKAVIPVHFSGQPCDMERIWALSRRYGFQVIEDASHAIGGNYKGAKIGACQYSHMTVFSFHPVKIITTGEGGMVLTRSAALYERLVRLRSHGITRESAQMRSAPEGPWYYEQLELGWNYRMTDIQAALGLSQMRRLDAFVLRRRSLANRYNQLLRGLPVTVPHQDRLGDSAWHLYVIHLALDGRHDRKAVFDSLRRAAIGVNVHYMPVYWQPYYRMLGFSPGYCPNAETYYRGAISLPMYPDLSEIQQEQVVHALESALSL